ncbi:hypothetical protein F8154_13755 [Alkaliphilus pronyensis]|uniref:DUF2178 domain-containing protein n=1 Tax=Alkaliphilus pronyensis TaxID=1482732 RepID=A0A6I0F1R7_9FIRM|nr:hypothetical protein [Alkaliphilus pronyensis]KAB3530489.1 hypothetical protein F8154_13755 [Alkaliphilus pronyensis]
MKREDIVMVISSIFVILVASLVTSMLELNSILENIMIDNLILGYLLTLCIIAFVLTPIVIINKRIYTSKEENKVKLTKDQKKRLAGGIALFGFVVLLVTGNPPVSYVFTYSSYNNALGFIVRAVYYTIIATFVSWYYYKIVNESEGE